MTDVAVVESGLAMVKIENPEGDGDKKISDKVGEKILNVLFLYVGVSG